MSAEFWAGYLSGAVGILIGNPLDVLKVKLQATSRSQRPHCRSTTAETTREHVRDSGAARSSRKHILSTFLAGTAAPVLGYGALNALLFVTYNRGEEILNRLLTSNPPMLHPVSSHSSVQEHSQNHHPLAKNLWMTWLAGCIGGLATWVVSTPTELIKCRVQLAASFPSSPNINMRNGGNNAPAGCPGSSDSSSSWQIAKQILKTEGIRGLYLGGVVTALRDGIGYGFYFWSYELAGRWWASRAQDHPNNGTGGHTQQQEEQGSVISSIISSDAAKVLLCGGLAGVVTWASIFPLDVIKTRVQTQSTGSSPNTTTNTSTVTVTTPLSSSRSPLSITPSCRAVPITPSSSNNYSRAGLQKQKCLGAVALARAAYVEEGLGVFFRGLAVCSVRAFIVNAVQWTVYEWIMLELGQKRRHAADDSEGVGERETF